MNFLASICIRRPVFATVLTLVLLVFGTVGYLNLGLDRFPKIDFPIITVTTRLPGSASEEVETEITDKIEEAVNTTSGIDELRSVSSEGISQVFITFVLEKDADIAAQEVRDKVNRVLPDLPRDIEQPFVEKFDPDSMPVMTIAVSSPSSIRDLTEYCDKVLRRQLESLSGVGQVLIVGGQKRQVNVHLDGLKMRSHGLTVADVARALQSQNLQVPGGTVKEGQLEFTLRTMGRVARVGEIEQIAVDNRGGHTITIGELGRVEDGAEEIKSLARYNDTPAVLLNIRKQSGTNTVEVSRLLKERLAELQKSAPPDRHITIVRDQSPFIQAAVDTVTEHLVLGGLLAAVVIFFFLANLRTTVISALAIPTSIVSAFSVVYFMGFTLNSITLLALALSVGIVIDDAIVVLENIYRHIEEKGLTPREAAFTATKEIGLAVLSITLSLVAVFLPIAFMGGIVGRFLKSFGITMSATILVSMIISFSLTPMLAARWLRRKDDKMKAEGGRMKDEGLGISDEGDILPSPDQPAVGARRGAGGEGELPLSATTTGSARPVPPLPGPLPEGEGGMGGSHHNGEGGRRQTASRGGAYAWIEGGYMALLGWSLRHRWVVVLAVVGMLAMVPALMGKVRKNFLPDDDQSEFEIKVRAPEGTSLEATFVVLDRIAREVRNLSGVAYTLTSVADDDQRIANLGTVYVRMAPLGQRSFDQFEMMNYVRETVLPPFRKQDLRISVSPAAIFSGGGMSQADVQFMIGGPEMKKLDEYSQKVMRDLRETPGAVDVDSSLVVGKPQYGVTIDRAKAADLGVSIVDAANTLRLLVAGDKVSDYNEKGEQYEVRVRAIAEFRNRLAELKDVLRPFAQARLRGPWRRGQFRKRLRARPDQPAQPQTPGDDKLQHDARHLAAGDPRRHPRERREARPGPRIHDRPVGQVQGDGPHVPQLPHRLRQRARLRLPGDRGPVRVVAAPDHHLALVAADSPLRPGLAGSLRAVAEHFFALGHPGVVRRGEEELDLADRPHDPAPRRRHAAFRGHPGGQSRPAAADPHDHGGLRGGHGSLAGLQQRGRLDEQGHQRRGDRRPDAFAAPDARRHAGGLFALR